MVASFILTSLADVVGQRSATRRPVRQLSGRFHHTASADTLGSPVTPTPRAPFRVRFPLHTQCPLRQRRFAETPPQTSVGTLLVLRSLLLRPIGRAPRNPL